MNNTVDCSIIIPVFNNIEYLEECLQSCVEQQTSYTFEIIIIDDFSEIDICKKVRGYNFNSNISCYKNTKKGVSSARNLGAKVSKGKYLAFIDSDDLMIKNRIQLQIEKLKTGENMIGLGGQIELIGNYQKSIKANIYPIRYMEILRKMAKGNFFACSTMMVEKKYYQLCSGMNPKINLAEDYDLWLRLLDIGPMINLPEVLTLYRSHELQTSKVRQIGVKINIIGIKFKYILSWKARSISKTYMLISIPQDIINLLLTVLNEIRFRLKYII
jgi:glycosyltransferase involved in cell wall biosynthesis